MKALSYRSGEGGGGPVVWDPGSELLLGGRGERGRESERIINSLKSKEKKNEVAPFDTSTTVGVEFNGGSSSDSNDLLSSLGHPFFFFCSFFFDCALIFLPTGLMLVSSPFSCFCPSHSRYLLRVVCPCNRYLFLFSTYSVPLAMAAFPFLFDLLASHSSEYLSYVMLSFLYSFFFFVSFFLFSLFLCSGLLCLCVLLPGTLALHLLCLDKLLLIGLLHLWNDTEGSTNRAAIMVSCMIVSLTMDGTNPTPNPYEIYR